MTTEQKVLKKVLENDGKASVQSVAEQLNISIGYASYLMAALMETGALKKSEKRDWYEIAEKGRRHLGIEGRQESSEEAAKEEKEKMVKVEPSPLLPSVNLEKAEVEIEKAAGEIEKAEIEIEKAAVSQQRLNKIIKVFKNLFAKKKLLTLEKAAALQKKFEKSVKSFKDLFTKKKS